jgi:hypothetical protein
VEYDQMGDESSCSVFLSFTWGLRISRTQRQLKTWPRVWRLSFSQ